MCLKTLLHPLKLVNAVHSLGLFGRVHEAAERGAELFATRPVGHPAQARTVPVYLAGDGVEGAFRVGFFFELGGVGGGVGG